MVSFIKKINIDWILFFSVLPLVGVGLVTMNSFVGENYFFSKQIMWAGISIAAFLGLSFMDFRFLKRTDVLMTLFLFAMAVLVFMLVFVSSIKGAQSWLSIGGFTLQPSDPIKLIVILILAKYFSRRHVEIANVRHILVSGFYAFVPFVLVFLQPDFGSAIIIASIWLGMIMASGISKKHLLTVLLTSMVVFSLLWSYGFEPHQKQRIITFLNPLTDIQGAGYNAYQSTIAVGSGELLGKGIGYGTQSRLEFLPEYQTDFIFAAFAEEWGFIGVLIVFILFGIMLWRILANALRGATNFEMLYGIGLATFFMSQGAIHIGMNIGLLPVTGLPIPFMSYGGSHLLTEFVGLGILMGMRSYSRATHRDNMGKEFLGI
ncbi:MAG: rod shape-determining protein RodA [Patescibacteria group bacterium]